MYAHLWLASGQDARAAEHNLVCPKGMASDSFRVRADAHKGEAAL